MARISALFIALLLSAGTSAQTISILGTATPAADWTTDYNMTQDPQNALVWTINITLTDGDVKFRQNGSWDVNWGGTDFPAGPAIPGGPNIPVTEGNYDVVFNAGELNYVFTLNTSYGNVGIGTESPQEKLDVNGNFRLSGEIRPGGIAGTDGQLLKSNGDGTMGWLTPPETTNASANGSVGYGTWGGCEMINISEYLPITDPNGAPSDLFGYAVAISGDLAIAGAYMDDGPAGANQGSVTFFKRNGTTGFWDQLGPKTYDPDAAAGDRFGSSVSISAEYAAVGAAEDVPGGSVTIFKRNTESGNWEQDGPKIFNSGAENFDLFGYTVSLNGDFLLVGAPFDDGPAGTNQGSAVIFKRNNNSNTWEFWQKLYNQNPQPNDFFGRSVSMDGDHAIIGASDDNETFAQQGSACIFKKNGEDVWELLGNKIVAQSPGLYDYYGFSVSISGDWAVVGAYGDDVNSQEDAGTVHLYKRDPVSGAWSLNRTLYNTDPQGFPRFGRSVNLSGDFLIAGAYTEDVPSGSQGTATIYINNGYTFQRIQKFHDPAGDNFGELGTSCAIDGQTRRFIVGAPGAYGDAGSVIFGKVE